MKNLTRAELHELANLLEQTRLWEIDSPTDEPDWVEVEAWADRLRSEAGPVEPKSLAARAVTSTLPHRVWAKDPGDRLWYVLNGSRADGLTWDQLLHSYSLDGVAIQITTPQED